jgi:Immunity protein 27
MNMRPDTVEIRLKPEETVLQGYWLDLGSSVVTDARWDRITLLTQEYLELLATGSDGKERLYRDPADGRLWEYTSVAPELAASPPLLQVITPERASAEYGIS